MVYGVSSMELAAISSSNNANRALATANHKAPKTHKERPGEIN